MNVFYEPQHAGLTNHQIFTFCARYRVGVRASPQPTELNLKRRKHIIV